MTTEACKLQENKWGKAAHRCVNKTQATANWKPVKDVSSYSTSELKKMLVLN